MTRNTDIIRSGCDLLRAAIRDGHKAVALDHVDALEELLLGIVEGIEAATHAEPSLPDVGGYQLGDPKIVYLRERGEL